ncbi:MAG: hypothetical protein A4C66_04105 [Nitrospira sp. HN-bin3]|uniref:hypothetical protein n=1 Tax=Nitrospira cf. moscoviensis SBR1015 TaxID=96242 RepID=UPI000A0AEE05|nr:hypothetical protein [Nitrospira cf. moscoviensis SBR1015]OQW33315.1 MAG: hypothetical protein A4C66_04105 [Nitrospira sp. HN-bin3]
MTRAKEAAIWRKMGREFERVGYTKRGGHPFEYGICFAASRHGLPSYSYDSARVRSTDSHGRFFILSFVEEKEVEGQKKVAAAFHRAMTCYLMAEMVKDGCAPGKGP